MASILRVNTLTDASSNNSTAMSIIHGGITRTWASFDGTASGATIGDSFNVSSSDDDGTGDYGINFSSNFNNATYCSTFGDGEGSATSGMRFLMDAGSTTSSQEIYGRNVSNSAADCGAASISINGDPA